MFISLTLSKRVLCTQFAGRNKFFDAKTTFCVLLTACGALVCWSKYTTTTQILFTCINLGGAWKIMALPPHITEGYFVQSCASIKSRWETKRWFVGLIKHTLDVSKNSRYLPPWPPSLSIGIFLLARKMELLSKNDNFVSKNHSFVLENIGSQSWKIFILHNIKLV